MTGVSPNSLPRGTICGVNPLTHSLRSAAAITSLAALALSIAAPANADALRFWADLARRSHEAEVRRLRPGTTVPWMTSDGRQIELVEWRTANVSLLTERSDHDPVLVRHLVDALDAYWKRCADLCGNAPPPDPAKGVLVKGRAIFAEAVRPAAELPIAPETARSVPVIGMPGIARVSIGTEAIEALLRGFNRGTPAAPLGDRLPEAIARTFVFFESELGAAAPQGFPPLANALAFLLAGEAQESLGWTVPPDERPFEGIVETYAAATESTYASTLARGEGIGAADAESLWTAMLLRLRHASGQRAFVQTLWTTLYECPPASDAEVAIGNLVVATSAAGRMSFVDQFRRWRFDISETTASRVQEALAPRKLDVRPKRPGSTKR